jgi:hypothetical protein
MELILYILIVYGITNIITREYIFEGFRNKMLKNEFFWQLFNCPTCLSFWIGICLSFISPLSLIWYNIIFNGFLCSGVINLIEFIKNKR